MNLPDTIEIRRLKVSTHIGVSDEEQSRWQTLLVSLKMVPLRGFEGLEDDISKTVNYYEVSLEIEVLAAAKPRRLIETFVVEIAEHLLAKYPLSKVEVTLEKHILPNTECVAVHVERQRSM